MAIISPLGALSLHLHLPAASAYISNFGIAGINFHLLTNKSITIRTFLEACACSRTWLILFEILYYDFFWS